MLMPTTITATTAVVTVLGLSPVVRVHLYRARGTKAYIALQGPIVSTNTQVIHDPIELREKKAISGERVDRHSRFTVRLERSYPVGSIRSPAVSLSWSLEWPLEWH